MSLGDDNAPSGTSNLEKFPAICSNCKKETTVPFKPEPGRAVYCKDCIAKIKSGELKIERRGEEQIKKDESKFFKPLADLGIEFDQGEVEEKGPKYSAPITSSPKIISSIKKVFTPSKAQAPVKQNTSLKQVLNKALATPPPAAIPVQAPIPEPISLEALKDKMKDVKDVKKDPVVSRDRAASEENMNMLKNLISNATAGQTTKTETKTEVNKEDQVVIPEPTPLPSSIISQAHTPAGDPVPKPPLTAGNIVREVPEDVLMKVLQE
jgi:CxxC-x17-CxxC domain-containing protein